MVNNMKTISILLLLVFLAENCFSEDSKLLTSAELKKLEDKTQQELKSTTNDEQKKYAIATKVARELYLYRFFEKSKFYYQKAIEYKFDTNKSEAYINNMACSIALKNKKQLEIDYQIAKEYFDKNGQYKTPAIEYYLKSIAAIIPNKNEKSIEYVSGFYGQFVEEEVLINLIKQKEYQKAFELLSPTGLKDSTDDFHITIYDSLNVYLNHKSVKTLYCDKQYKEYPQSFALSTLSCGLLNDYLKNGTFSSDKLKRASEYFSMSDNKEKKFIFDLLREIK